MRKAVAAALILAAGGTWWVMAKPRAEGLTDSDISRLKGQIRSAYMAKDTDVEVLDVQLSRISPKELKGYVRFRFGMLPASNHSCTAIMDQAGVNTSWKCAPERP